MTPATSDAAAWSAVLPPGTIWLSGGPSQLRAPANLRANQLRCPAVAVAAPPWALRGRPADSSLAYIAVPSRERPLLVASRDPAVLRYLADSVLSVPPGAKGFASFALTLGLRTLRLRLTWMLAALVRAGGVVLVRRAP